MKRSGYFLWIGFLFSVCLHGSVFYYFVSMKNTPVDKLSYSSSVLVPVKINKKKNPQVKPVIKKKTPKLEPVKKKKKKVIRITKKTRLNPVPFSHKRTLTEKPTKSEDTKPVFGVTKQTVLDMKGGGMGVRTGNTLMQEQEEEYTPPEEVKEYITIPVFELTTMPVFKQRVIPEYPETLKDEELEGDVALSVTINDKGKVTEVVVLRTDHILFAKAAVKALKASLFQPATQNGEPVSTILDDLVYTFVLDD